MGIKSGRKHNMLSILRNRGSRDLQILAAMTTVTVIPTSQINYNIKVNITRTPPLSTPMAGPPEKMFAVT